MAILSCASNPVFSRVGGERGVAMQVNGHWTFSALTTPNYGEEIYFFV